MPVKQKTARCLALRGEIFHLLGDPAQRGKTYEHFPDGVLVINNGLIERCGPSKGDPAAATAKRFDGTLVPGLIDTHVHFPQLGVLASYGTELLGWLKQYTFPFESKFDKASFAKREADKFLDAMLACGTTTALVFATTNPISANALFAAAAKRNLRLVTGKTLSDRVVPAALRDTPATARADSERLIAKWHGKGRLGYAVTPRFAVTSTDKQLAIAGELLASHPGVMLHTHISENKDEIKRVAELFPKARDYLDAYEQAGLVTDRSVFAHAIHLRPREWRALANAGSSLAFCPCSNLFLGSGLFRVGKARRHGVKHGLGSDVGGGNTLSMMRVMDEAYKVARMAGDDIAPLALWYLTTLGGARALGLDAYIGNFAPGKEADFVILNGENQPLLANRLSYCKTIEERLFAYAVLGDERAVDAVHVMGVRQPSARKKKAP